MKTLFAKPIAVALSFTLLAACTAPGSNSRDTVRNAANPAVAPQRTITGFTDALRCMDDKFFDAGVRDVTIMMEELQDATKRLGVGTRDMMIAAISDMSRRSRAVRLSVFGNDNQNLTTVLQQAQRQNSFQVLPEYDIRGSISQLDDDVEKRTSSIGAAVESVFGLRFGRDVRFSVLGFDTAVVRTEDFTLIPGVNSRNTVVIARQETSAGDGTAKILKANLTFSFAINQQEGVAQSLRNMVELSAIELVGKLTRTPYWQCLKIPDDSPDVKREVSDWYHSMDNEESIRFFQERLRERRFYDGALDGQRSEEFDRALSAYQTSLNLPISATIDEKLFRAIVMAPMVRGQLANPPRTAKPAGNKSETLLANSSKSANPSVNTNAASAAAAGAGVVSVLAIDPSQGQSDAKPARNLAVADAAQTSPLAGTPPTPAMTAPQRPALMMFGRTHSGIASLETGFTVLANAPGYVYCYTSDPRTQKIQRVFPNRYQRDPRISAGQAISLPENRRIKFPLADGQKREFACLLAPREIYSDLPAALRWGDFEDIRLTSFGEIQNRFMTVAAADIPLVTLKTETP